MKDCHLHNRSMRKILRVGAHLNYTAGENPMTAVYCPLEILSTAVVS